MFVRNSPYDCISQSSEAPHLANVTRQWDRFLIMLLYMGRELFGMLLHVIASLLPEVQMIIWGIAYTLRSGNKCTVTCRFSFARIAMFDKLPIFTNFSKSVIKLAKLQ